MSKLLSILTMTLLIGVLSSSSTTAVLPECKIPEEGEIPVIGGYYYLIDDFVCVRLDSVLLGPFAPSFEGSEILAYAGTVQVTLGTLSFPAAGFGQNSACESFLGLNCTVIEQYGVSPPSSDENVLCLYTADYRISLTQNGPPVTYSGTTVGLC